MTVSDFAEIVAVVRDSLLIVLLILALATVLLTFRKLSSLLDSVNRTVKNAEEVSEAISSHIVEPASSGSGVAFGVGKVAAFIMGLRRKKKNKEQGGESNGEQ